MELVVDTPTYRQYVIPAKRTPPPPAFLRRGPSPVPAAARAPEPERVIVDDPFDFVDTMPCSRPGDIGDCPF